MGSTVWHFVKKKKKCWVDRLKTNRISTAFCITLLRNIIWMLNTPPVTGPEQVRLLPFLQISETHYDYYYLISCLYKMQWWHCRSWASSSVLHALLFLLPSLHSPHGLSSSVWWASVLWEAYIFQRQQRSWNLSNSSIITVEKGACAEPWITAGLS